MRKKLMPKGVIVEGKIYTLESASELLGMSVEALRRLCKEARITHSFVSQRYLINGWSLRQFTEQIRDVRKST